MTPTAPDLAAPAAERPRVVILGGGFAGLEAAKALDGAPASVTLIDRQNHHCFQPLLYQVATATLSPADVAWPIRGILGGRNVQVVMAEVTGIDRLGRRVATTAGHFPFDVLVVATGAAHAYFGHDEWAAAAPGLKRIEDATEIRRRLLMAFERAEVAPTVEERERLTTFVVVGGGPTGVEMAGAIADLAREALPPDFRNVDPASSRILLVEAGPRILSTFPEKLSAYAERELERHGVEVVTGTAVTGIEETGVRLGERRIPTGAVVWAAGVAASPAARWLGVERDRAGRVKVGPDLSLPGDPDIFVVGDTALVEGPGERPVPGLAPAAKQMGRYVGRLIRSRLEGREPPKPFAYRHEGDLATIGRSAAIVKAGRLELTGFLAWAFWGIVHVYFLIGLRHRIAVAFSWMWDYVTFGRRARLITQAAGAPPAEALAGGPSAEPARPPTAGTTDAPERRIWS